MARTFFITVVFLADLLIIVTDTQNTTPISNHICNTSFANNIATNSITPALETIFTLTDQSTLRAETRQLLSAHAAVLNLILASIRLEGHAVGVVLVVQC